MLFTRVPEAVREVLEKAELSTDDISWFLLHQANIRIIEGVAKTSASWDGAFSF